MGLEIDFPFFEEKIYGASTHKDLEQIKVEIFGKSGILTSAFKILSSTGDATEKKKLGEKLNEIKSKLENAIRVQLEKLDTASISEKMRSEEVDVTIPSGTKTFGGKHIITRSMGRIKDYFSSYGFDIADGPEIEEDFYNFTALNIGEHHPARQAHDSFYIAGHPGKLLRTHTSGIQIRYMMKNPLPIRMISIGKVFRNDNLDSTHSPMFHQVEGLVVDRKPVSIGHLKKILYDFMSFFFETDVEIRFRSSFFPFTEPSVEVDCRYERGGSCESWLELGGAGMVHPNVFRSCGISEDVYGFAFGMGIDRLTMLKNKISDVRDILSTDQRWLRHSCCYRS